MSDTQSKKMTAVNAVPDTTRILIAQHMVMIDLLRECNQALNQMPYHRLTDSPTHSNEQLASKISQTLTELNGELHP